jgi:hypothetical protein
MRIPPERAITMVDGSGASAVTVVVPLTFALPLLVKNTFKTFASTYDELAFPVVDVLSGDPVIL